MKTVVKKMLLILLAALCVLTLSSVAVFAADEGDFDGSLHYRYDDATNTLTISGTGPMTSVYGAPFSRPGVKHLVIEEGVTALPTSAFQSNSTLESVYVAGSVKHIGDYAFQYCPKLRSVTLGEGVEEIGKYAMAQYQYNNVLTQIDLPDSLKVLGNNAFDGAQISTVNIPAGVTVLPSNLFRNCKNLKEVTLPEGVEALAESAFRNSYVERVNLPESLKTIGADAFNNCFALQQINIPRSVKILPERAFYGCRSLESVTINNRLDSIGSACFSGSGLKLLQFTAGAPIAISEDAFSGLSLVFLYDNSKDSQLWHNITGNSYGAAKYRWIYSLACGQTMSDTVFWRYENKTLYIEGSGRMADYVDASPADQGLSYIPPWYPLESAIERIIVGEGVTRIGNYSFDGCSMCRSIVFPATVTELGKPLFSHCGNLNTICFMGNLPVIGDKTFPNSSGITATIYYRQDKSNWENWFTDYKRSHSNIRLSLSEAALPLWICGRQVCISDMEQLVLTDSIPVREGVTYEPKSKCLFLDGVTLNAVAGSGTRVQDVSVIYADQDLTIRLDGAPCTLTAADSDPSYGIYVTGALDIVGSGTLSVSAGRTNSDSSNSCGISAAALKITGAAVNAAAGKSDANSFGVRLTGDAPELQLENAELNAVGDWAWVTSAGLDMKGGRISIDSRSKMYAYGGTVACYFEGLCPQVSIPEEYRVYGGSSPDDTYDLELSLSPANSGHYFTYGTQLAQYLWIDTSPTYYDNIYVDGERLNSMTLSRNEHMSYTPADGSAPATLYLNNVDLGKTMGNSGDKIYNAAAIYAKGDLNIVVSGNNTVTGPNSYVGNMSYGIYVEGKLALSGSGTLTAAGGSPMGSPTQKGSYGIRAEGFSMSDPDLYVMAVGADVSGAVNNNRSYGIYSNGSVDVSGGTLNAVAGSGDRGYGIYVSTGEFRHNGGHVCAEAGSSSTGYGICMNAGLLALSGNVDLTVRGSTRGIKLIDSDTLAGCSGQLCIISLLDPNAPEPLPFSTESLQTKYYTILPAGVTVTGGSGSHGDPGHVAGVTAHSANADWLTGTTTVTITDRTDSSVSRTTVTTRHEGTANASHEDYSFTGIRDGAYTVTIDKDHFAPKKIQITVEGSNVNIAHTDLYMYGDTDLNGIIDAADVTKLLRHVAGIETISDADSLAVSDVNRDGRIDASDVTNLLRYVAGIDSVLKP